MRTCMGTFADSKADGNSRVSTCWADIILVVCSSARRRGSFFGDAALTHSRASQPPRVPGRFRSQTLLCWRYICLPSSCRRFLTHARLFTSNSHSALEPRQHRVRPRFSRLLQPRSHPSSPPLCGHRPQSCRVPPAFQRILRQGRRCPLGLSPGPRP